ncbi:MAG: inositol monophosphatase family protein [Hyphomicrobiaceae bacterium]
MPQSLHDDVLAIMRDVAATEVMPRWRNLASTDIAVKTGPDDLVTVADQAAEAALTERLSKLLANASVIGEEAVAADPTVRERFRRPGPVWVIDPIDGTSAFAAGEPDFTLMVALVQDGAPAAGWIVAPALDHVVWGGMELGVWQAKGSAPPTTLTRPAIPETLSDMIGLLGKRNITPERRAELQARELHFKALDGVTYAGIDYQRLATGKAHFAAYSKSEPWDHLPGLAILRTLGFHYARYDGSAYRPGDNEGGLLVAPGVLSFACIRKILFT